MPTLLTSLNNHLLLTGPMNGNQNQRDCNDSSNGTACKDLFFSRSLVVSASPGKLKKLHPNIARPTMKTQSKMQMQIAY